MCYNYKSGSQQKLHLMVKISSHREFQFDLNRSPVACHTGKIPSTEWGAGAAPSAAVLSASVLCRLPSCSSSSCSGVVDAVASMAASSPSTHSLLLYSHAGHWHHHCEGSFAGTGTGNETCQHWTCALDSDFGLLIMVSAPGKRHVNAAVLMCRLPSLPHDLKIGRCLRCEVRDQR